MALSYSVMATLRMNGINALKWLEDYLGACAVNGGEAPGDISRWLPWEMDEQRFESMRIVPRGMGP